MPTDQVEIPRKLLSNIEVLQDKIFDIVMSKDYFSLGNNNKSQIANIVNVKDETRIYRAGSVACRLDIAMELIRSKPDRYGKAAADTILDMNRDLAKMVAIEKLGHVFEMLPPDSKIKIHQEVGKCISQKHLPQKDEMSYAYRFVHGTKNTESPQAKLNHEMMNRHLGKDAIRVLDGIILDDHKNYKNALLATNQQISKMSGNDMIKVVDTGTKLVGKINDFKTLNPADISKIRKYAYALRLISENVRAVDGLFTLASREKGKNEKNTVAEPVQRNSLDVRSRITAR